MDAHMEKGIGGVDKEVAEPVSVGKREEVRDLLFCYMQACFFLYLSYDGLFASFPRVDKTANQIERAFGWFVCSSGNQYLSFFILYDSNGGSGSIEVVGEITIFAVLRLVVVHCEAL